MSRESSGRCLQQDLGQAVAGRDGLAALVLDHNAENAPFTRTFLMRKCALRVSGDFDHRLDRSLMQNNIGREATFN